MNMIEVLLGVALISSVAAAMVHQTGNEVDDIAARELRQDIDDIRAAIVLSQREALRDPVLAWFDLSAVPTDAECDPSLPALPAVCEDGLLLTGQRITRIARRMLDRFPEADAASGSLGLNPLSGNDYEIRLHDQKLKIFTDILGPENAALATAALAGRAVELEPRWEIGQPDNTVYTLRVEAQESAGRLLAETSMSLGSNFRVEEVGADVQIEEQSSERELSFARNVFIPTSVMTAVIDGNRLDPGSECSANAMLISQDGNIVSCREKIDGTREWAIPTSGEGIADTVGGRATCSPDRYWSDLEKRCACDGNTTDADGDGKLDKDEPNDGSCFTKTKNITTTGQLRTCRTGGTPILDITYDADGNLTDSEMICAEAVECMDLVRDRDKHAGAYLAPSRPGGDGKICTVVPHTAFVPTGASGTHTAHFPFYYSSRINSTTFEWKLRETRSIPSCKMPDGSDKTPGYTTLIRLSNDGTAADATYKCISGWPDVSINNNIQSGPLRINPMMSAAESLSTEEQGIARSLSQYQPNSFNGTLNCGPWPLATDDEQRALIGIPTVQNTAAYGTTKAPLWCSSITHPSVPATYGGAGFIASKKNPSDGDLDCPAIDMAKDPIGWGNCMSELAMTMASRGPNGFGNIDGPLTLGTSPPVGISDWFNTLVSQQEQGAFGNIRIVVPDMSGRIYVANDSYKLFAKDAHFLKPEETPQGSGLSKIVQGTIRLSNDWHCDGSDDNPAINGATRQTCRDTNGQVVEFQSEDWRPALPHPGLTLTTPLYLAGTWVDLPETPAVAIEVEVPAGSGNWQPRLVKLDMIPDGPHTVAYDTVECEVGWPSRDENKCVIERQLCAESETELRDGLTQPSRKRICTPTTDEDDLYTLADQCMATKDDSTAALEARGIRECSVWDSVHAIDTGTPPTRIQYGANEQPVFIGLSAGRTPPPTP